MGKIVDKGRGVERVDNLDIMLKAAILRRGYKSDEGDPNRPYPGV